MNTSTKVMNDKIEHLAEDAEALIHTARDFASQQAEEISNHLADGCARSKELYHLVRAKGVEGSQALNQELHTHSFRYLAIVAGLGVVLGFAIANRCRASHS
jgi:ElaB/YqjD/DUF883 family membrane-anchored ribosome-binding protein